MYKLEFTLKQHTPIIHFQHDQDGATLRATEVKPKLDRFIINYLKEVNTLLYNKYEALIEKEFIPCVKNKNKSLYSIFIESEIERKVLLFSLTSQSDANLITQHKNSILICGNNPEIYWKTPLFCNNSSIKFEGKTKQGTRGISNLSKWDDLRIGVWLKNIKIKIVSQSFDLVNLINECLPYLFSIENFGLRQSKGFGSFSIENQIEDHLKSFIGKHSICIYKKEDTSNWNKKMEYIREFWKLLKAGDSYGRYYKSDLMKYFCMLDGTRWEKRKIKKSLHDNHQDIYNSLRVTSAPNRIAGCISDSTSPDDVPTNQNYKYIRALLGLAEHFEFGVNGNNPLKVKISNPKVERFKSPVTFKVTNDAIYLICFPIDPELSDDGENYYSFDIDKPNGNLARLSIPVNFNLCHFFDSPWLGNNFENSAKWGQNGVETVAEHHKFRKLTV